MYSALKQIRSFAFIAGSGQNVIGPIYEAFNLIGPYALSILLVLSIFYGIFLGVKYAKAEDAAAKANTLTTLKNFLIGFFIIIVLYAILYAIHDPLAQWIDEG